MSNLDRSPQPVVLEPVGAPLAAPPLPSLPSRPGNFRCFDILPGLEPRVLRPHLGKLPALLQIARSARPARAPVPVLLDREVPHEPGLGAMVPQHYLLGGRGDQTVPGHTNTLANTTDISGEVKRRILPGPKAGVSTPRS